MTKCLKSGVLLIAAAMASCALVLPSAAGAASWTVIGSHHTLDSPNLGFSYTWSGGPATVACLFSSFTTNVRSAAVLTITNASVSSCTTSNPTGFGTCTMTWVATGLPWTATALTTSNIQIHGINFDVTYETVPGNPGPCHFNGLQATITGTLTAGQWTGNGVNQHEVTFNGVEGLSEHTPFGTNQWTTFGTLRDTQQTLLVD